MYRFFYWLVLQRLPAEGTHKVSFALLRVLKNGLLVMSRPDVPQVPAPAPVPTAPPAATADECPKDPAA